MYRECLKYSSLHMSDPLLCHFSILILGRTNTGELPDINIWTVDHKVLTPDVHKFIFWITFLLRGHLKGSSNRCLQSYHGRLECLPASGDPMSMRRSKECCGYNPLRGCQPLCWSKEKRTKMVTVCLAQIWLNNYLWLISRRLTCWEVAQNTTNYCVSERFDAFVANEA